MKMRRQIEEYWNKSKNLISYLKNIFRRVRLGEVKRWWIKSFWKGSFRGNLKFKLLKKRNLKMICFNSRGQLCIKEMHNKWNCARKCTNWHQNLRRISFYKKRKNLKSNKWERKRRRREQLMQLRHIIRTGYRCWRKELKMNDLRERLHLKPNHLHYLKWRGN